ncbi:uncharacterized protein LOC120898589 [Anopheles arabiensis]|uniref:Uncharacterized protein n=1 Tax=Anopheles arabiensis TaxID=7173 RepID=A0A182HZL4_ANOAR|nr:uncharacterized protein LOC120898589 [Anopheles arabiensis]
MPAMAHRCTTPAATSSPPSAPSSSPSPFAAREGPALPNGAEHVPKPAKGSPVGAEVGTVRPAVGTVVGGLIGKFECSRECAPADVKVTANSGRAGDSALIADRDSPITNGRAGPPAYDGQVRTARYRASVTGSERPDKPVMGARGATGNAGRLCAGDTLNAEMSAACVRRAGGRQRKTVVYSRLCLDDALLLEAGNGADGSGRLDGWATRQAEVIRFPCVERLIELYANIIRQKEAEVQRFMSSIVRSGDKSRLDKGAPPAERRWQGEADGPHGSKRQRQGDMERKTLAALPASVSLESLSQAKTVGPDRTSTIPSGDDAARVSRTSTSPAQSDEGWRSDDEERERAAHQDPAMKNRDKVTRSASSDSALGLDDELSAQEQQQAIATVGKVRRLTLGVSDIPLRAALLPVPEPATLPSLTLTDQHCPTVVRSKMILEAQLIELPLAGGELPAEQQPGQQQLGCPPSTSVSRRESAQSYISDAGTEGVRYVRTPSVVVSDYSDDTMCGITLEEIEYFRRHRLRRGSADCESDISAASSCSNLNYCGSSISALDGCEYQCGLRTPERKVSDCSTCSTVSCDEDEGYSRVVRAKLATLSCLPAADTVAEETELPPAVPASPAKPVVPVAAIDEPGETGADVRVCSKKKVSSVGNSCG